MLLQPQKMPGNTEACVLIDRTRSTYKEKMYLARAGNSVTPWTAPTAFFSPWRSID
jgi:hypothetical protein